MTEDFAAGWRAALEAASEMLADIAASGAHGLMFTETVEQTETLAEILGVMRDISVKVLGLPMPEREKDAAE
jgi:hypothetical protein